MKNGDALPDDEVVRILKLKLDKSTQLKIKGYVLDGFPENLNQAKLFFETPDKLPLENESDCVELWRIEEGPVSEVKECDEPEQPLDYKPNMAIHLRVSKANIHDGQLWTSINHPEFEAKLLDCPKDCSRVKKPSSLLDYFLGKDITLIGTLVEDELEDVIPKLISKIGPPRIYGSSFEEDMGEILMNTPNDIDSPLTKMSDEILKYEPLLINNIPMSKLGLIGRRIKSIMNSLTGIFHPSSSTDVIHKDRPTNTEYLPKQKESTGKYSERQQLYKSTMTNEYSDEEASYKRIDFEETRGCDALTKEKEKGTTDSEHPDRPGSVLSRCLSTETLWSIDLNTENHV
ncbi:hypothetical protein AAG570_008150 [Ranatra chinensis]|uniref:Uncharacterized protein n=1 Tax=Ranatra chinensis TaxID=642074 RepID=A0ABD0XV82_9HEMI